MASMKTNTERGQRAMLNTTIDKEILDGFKSYCKERGYPMNILLEMFMHGMIDGQFVLKLGKNNDIEVDLED